MAGQRPDLSVGEPGLLTLLADLLRLPGDIDAAAWLSTERADLCAVLVLRFLLDSVIPGPEAIGREPILRKVASYARCRVADGELDVVVTGVSVHRAGFTAHIEARFPEPADRVADVAWSTWEGIPARLRFRRPALRRAAAGADAHQGGVAVESRLARDDRPPVHAVHSTRPDRDLRIAVRRDLLVPAGDAGRSACPAARAQPRANRVQREDLSSRRGGFEHATCLAYRQPRTSSG